MMQVHTLPRHLRLPINMELITETQSVKGKALVDTSFHHICMYIYVYIYISVAAIGVLW